MYIFVIKKNIEQHLTNQYFALDILNAGILSSHRDSKSLVVMIVVKRYIEFEDFEKKHWNKMFNTKN